MEMYRPAAFRVDGVDEIVGLVRSVGVGHLVSVHDGQLHSSFVPILIDDGAGVVRAHLARANPHARALISDGPTEALLIVTGAQGYVSPGSYASKLVDQRVVPTWNYELVHMHGTLTAVDSDELVADVVRTLTDVHEAARDDPWSVDDAPDDYLATMRKAIVAVELQVERVAGKRKLSQNRSVDDIVGVIRALRASEQAALAAATLDANVQFVDVAYDDPEVVALMERYLHLLIERAAASGITFDVAFGAGTAAGAQAEDFHGGAFIGARVGDRIVGCGGVRMHGDDAELKRMFVDDSARGAGLGRRLLDELLSRAGAAGARVVRLDTRHELTEAIAMYESVGFVRCERYNDNPFADRWFERAVP